MKSRGATVGGVMRRWKRGRIVSRGVALKGAMCRGKRGNR